MDMTKTVTHSPDAHSQRRRFLKQFGWGTFATLAGVTVVPAELARAAEFGPLWNSAQLFIGNSTVEQPPSPFIRCPLFLANGHFADAFHTLDLSNLPNAIGTMEYHDDVIEAVIDSLAATTTIGNDGSTYLLAAGDGTVTDGEGFFNSVTRVVFRCQYKIAPVPGPLLLIACIDCVVILVRA